MFQILVILPTAAAAVFLQFTKLDKNWVDVIAIFMSNVESYCGWADVLFIVKKKTLTNGEIFSMT